MKESGTINLPVNFGQSHSFQKLGRIPDLHEGVRCKASEILRNEAYKLVRRKPAPAKAGEGLG
jgi:hypothetical protein